MADDSSKSLRGVVIVIEVTDNFSKSLKEQQTMCRTISLSLYISGVAEKERLLPGVVVERGRKSLYQEQKSKKESGRRFL